MNQEIKLSFLLCTLNREDDFKRSIKSLFENDNKGISFEVVVVDQGLSDNVLEVCKLHGAIYIPTDSRGLSLARNIGLKRCNGTFIALMDDDAYISDSYFKDFLSIIENKKYFPNDVFSGRIMTIENNSEPLSRYQVQGNKEINYYNIDTVLSSALVIKKSILDSVNNFDESFGVGARWGGSEETDLISRIIHEKNSVKYFSSLIVFHPRTDFNNMTYKDTFYKTFTYGLGRGAYLRKNSFLPRYLIIKSLGMPIFAFFVSVVTLNPKNAVRYLSSFLGRLKGFVAFTKI